MQPFYIRELSEELENPEARTLYTINFLSPPTQFFLFEIYTLYTRYFESQDRNNRKI